MRHAGDEEPDESPRTLDVEFVRSAATTHFSVGDLIAYGSCAVDRVEAKKVALESGMNISLISSPGDFVVCAVNFHTGCGSKSFLS